MAAVPTECRPGAKPRNHRVSLADLIRAAVLAGTAMLAMASPAAALDLRVGQAWSCDRQAPATTLVYVIGALEPAGPLNPADPDLEIAHLSISGIVEGAQTVPVDIPHMAVVARSLGCAGQTYLSEGALASRDFPMALARWRTAVGATGIFIAEERAVDQAVLEQLGISEGN